MAENKRNWGIIGKACLVIIFIILVMPIVSSLIGGILLSIEASARRVVLYQSPAGGENVQIGEWKFGEVEIDPPPENMMNMYAIQVAVLDWGDCRNMLNREYGMQWMDINEFQSLNSTQIEALFGNSERFISYNRTLTTESSSSITKVGTYVWAFRYVGTYGEVPAATLRVSILISVIHEQSLVP
ncbi:MAG: hypothetical protein RTU92_05415 [Candidatus Thorarchaeota archaeon]